MIYKLFFSWFLLLGVCVNAQYTVYSDGNKQGIKRDNAIIIKAKYEQALIGDTAVFALYKKKTCEYRTAEGKQIISRKYAVFLPFQNGYGLVMDSKHFTWQTIDVQGTVIGEYFGNETPVVYGKIVLFKGRGIFFDHHGKQLCVSYNSYENLNENLIQIKRTEALQKGKKIFGIYLKTTREVEVTTLLNSATGKVLNEGYAPEKIGTNLWYVKGNDPSLGFIIDASGKIIEKDIKACTPTGEKYAVLATPSGAGFLNLQTKDWLIKPDGIGKVEKVSDVYWASAMDSSYSVVVDEKNGSKQIEGIKAGMASADRVIVLYHKQMAIYDLQGNKLSEDFDVVYDKVTYGRLIVISKNRFAYVHVESGKLTSNYYPLYYTIGQRGIGERGKRFITNLANVFATPFVPYLTRKLEKYSLSSYSYIYNEPQLFQEDYAIVSVGDMSKAISRHDSLFIPDGGFSLNYVFIDTLGKEVSPRYEEAYPFNGLWTWVKSAKGYQRVDRQFKPLASTEFFRDVQPVWDQQYYIVEKDLFKTGLMNSKGEWIAKPIYSMIMQKDNSLVGITTGADKVLVTK